MPQQKQTSFQKGFTLVEMAIVMIIIGLLIGGVLKGQEIMNASKINGIVKELQSLDSALSLFYQKYSMLPGDMTTPENFLPNCSTAPCNADGDNDGDYEANPFATLPTIGDERFNAPIHLAAAGLITGVENASVLEVGRTVPRSAIGGGYVLGTMTASTTAPDFYEGGTWILAFHSMSAAGINPNAFLVSDAAAIDRKLDDGVGRTGKIVGAALLACPGCVDANGRYIESYTDVRTGVLFKTTAP